jgi:hypothetical protein
MSYTTRFKNHVFKIFKKAIKGKESNDKTQFYTCILLKEMCALHQNDMRKTIATFLIHWEDVILIFISYTTYVFSIFYLENIFLLKIPKCSTLKSVTSTFWS